MISACAHSCSPACPWLEGIIEPMACSRNATLTEEPLPQFRSYLRATPLSCRLALAHRRPLPHRGAPAKRAPDRPWRICSPPPASSRGARGHQDRGISPCLRRLSARRPIRTIPSAARVPAQPGSLRASALCRTGRPRAGRGRAPAGLRRGRTRALPVWRGRG